MRLALFFLSVLTLPALALAQETKDEAPQVFGVWQIEPGNAKRAATIEFTRDEDLSYGFSCWKGHWLFFFNYQAPQGGQCEDSDECESEVSDADLIFQIPERPATDDHFTLFENYYFQDENLSVADIEAMIKANHFRLQFDDKLKAIWQKDSLDFPLHGFETAVTDAKKVFSCTLHEPVPVPAARPDLTASAAKAKKPDAKKTSAKKAHPKKSKAARAKAAKSKLPSHALKKKAKKHGAQKTLTKKKKRR